MLAPSAFAQEENASGRYTMTPTEEGILRLDTETGAVSICARQSGGWACKSIADDRLALQAEIDRLTLENAQLRAALDKAVPELPDEHEPGGGASWLPSDRHVDQLMAFLEKLARRFQDMVDSLQKENPESRM